MIKRLDLLVQQTEGEVPQENFRRIENFVNREDFLKGQFKFYEVETTAAVTNGRLKHNLKFTPKDVLLLSVNPYTATVTFRYNSFDSDAIYYNTSAGATFRFLLGRYET